MSAPAPSPRRPKPELDDGHATPSTKAPRRFTPKPVETSTRSSKQTHKTPGNEDVRSKGPRRFAVKPIETTRTNNKKSEHASAKDNSHVTDDFSGDVTHGESKQGRKFAVQFIGTASHARKAGDTVPAVPHSQRTEIIPPHHPRFVGPDDRANLCDSSGDEADKQDVEMAEARRLGLPLPKRRGSMSSLRSHSFHIPDLEPIESSESERSDAPSIPSVPSDVSISNMLRRRHGSLDSTENFRRLAARHTARHMRNAALAAYPNDDRHRPVRHYVDTEDEDNYMSDAWSIAESDTPANGRCVKINWEMRELQKHAEGRAVTKGGLKSRKEKLSTRSKKSSPWTDASAALRLARNGGRESSNDYALDSMKTLRNSARPPMLGGDIVFPRCPSPEPARFDVTQGAEACKRAVGSFAGQGGQHGSSLNSTRNVGSNGMWSLSKVDSCEKAKPTLWGQTSRSPSPDKGLWGGSCRGGTGLTPPRGPTGLITPMIPDEDVVGVSIPHGLSPHQLPPSPPPSNSGSDKPINSLEERLRLEQDIDAEFADSFVTQVYNYLSLGYPSMARKFDHELAKIARIDVSELRRDDVIAGARGYVRFGEENGLDVDDAGEDIKEHHCARWRALRMYVREWARQQPSWREEQRAWGVPARKGSWAI